MAELHTCSSKAAARAIALVTARTGGDLDAQSDLLGDLGVDPCSELGTTMIGLTTLAATALEVLAVERGVETGDLLAGLGLHVAQGA